MLKRIREEKTFKDNLKGDIKEALEVINEEKDTTIDPNREELEELWLSELIQRKKNEVKLEALSAANRDEEVKQPSISSKYANE